MFTKRDIPTSFESANLMLGVRKSRRISQNGELYRLHDSAIVLRLHCTDIVTWTDDGWVTLNHGGWVTVTTKSWVNAALRGTRWHVYSKRWEPFLYDACTGKSSTWSRSISVRVQPVGLVDLEAERAALCTCSRCPNCDTPRMVCGECGRCARCSEHTPGCPGCPAKQTTLALEV